MLCETKVNCPKGWGNWIEGCLQEVRRWGIPPNWSEADWQEELKSVAMLAAWVAVCTYNPQHHVNMEQFVKGRIKAALLQRCREEWRFARQCCYPTLPSNSAEDGEGEMLFLEEIPGEIDNAAFWWRIEVRDVLSRLPPAEHYLLERLFIDGATESEIADELNISQPTVSRWKQKVLQKLRQMLSEQASLFAESQSRDG